MLHMVQCENQGLVSDERFRPGTIDSSVYTPFYCCDGIGKLEFQ